MRIDDPALYNPFGWRVAEIADPATDEARRRELLESLLICEAEELMLELAETEQVDLVKRVEASFGAQLSIVYGMTECSPLLSQVGLDDDFADKTETLGRRSPRPRSRSWTPSGARSSRAVGSVSSAPAATAW